MAVMRDKPYSGMNFTLDLGTGKVDGPEAGLLEVIFPEARLHVLEYRSGNDKEPAARKMQTVSRYGNVILTRAVIGSLNWYAWWNEIRNGVQDLRTVVVKLMNEDHSTVVLTWKFLRARPVNYQFSPLNAQGTELLKENLELACERLEME